MLHTGTADCRRACKGKGAVRCQHLIDHSLALPQRALWAALARFATPGEPGQVYLEHWQSQYMGIVGVTHVLQKHQSCCAG